MGRKSLSRKVDLPLAKGAGERPAEVNLVPERNMRKKRDTEESSYRWLYMET